MIDIITVRSLDVQNFFTIIKFDSFGMFLHMDVISFNTNSHQQVYENICQHEFFLLLFENDTFNLKAQMLN